MFCRRLDAGLLVAISCSSSQIVHTPFPVVKNSLKYGNTIHHELIAGHHLQQFMRDRYKAYRHFDTPFWVEGNSLYWEMLLWDLKFPQTPQDKIGMLFWRMHRCARIIFSLKNSCTKISD